MSSPAELLPTLGPIVVKWIEGNLRCGIGDDFGKPARLRPEQKAAIYRYYELWPKGHPLAGRRRWGRVVRGRPKGEGKSQFSGWIAAAEMAGPVRFDGWHKNGRPKARRVTSPEIPIGANNWEQADKVFEQAKLALQGAPDDPGPLAEFFDFFDSEVVFKDGRPGRIYRVAAVAGTNDGGLPTFSALDETHEMTGRRVHFHTVMSQNAEKREDSWMLETTTAGDRGAGSVAEAAWQMGRDIAAGKVDDFGTIVDWLEASDHWDLQDPEQLEAAVCEANVRARTDPAFLQGLLRRFHTPTTLESDFRRYHLNQWVEAIEESWMSEHPTAWADGTRHGVRIPNTEPVWAAVDLSLTNDTSALVVVNDGAETIVEPTIWEPVDGRIDISEIQQAIRDLAARFGDRLRAVGYDPRFFEVAAQELLDEGYPMVEFPQSQERMVPACGHAYERIVNRKVLHPGDPTFDDQVRSAARRRGERGWTLSKGKSRRKIDGAIAMVMAMWLAATVGIRTVPEEPRRRVKSFRGI